LSYSPDEGDYTSRTADRLAPGRQNARSTVCSEIRSERRGLTP